MMHGREDSDSAIVAKKSANNVEQSTAESTEPRAETKGKAIASTTRRTQGRESVSPGLDRLPANSTGKERFTALLHHVDVDLLSQAYHWLKRDAAAGVDGVTWRAYGVDLQANLADLHDRVHRGAYRAAIAASDDSEARWPRAPARHRLVGRQDCPACARRGLERDIRGGLSRLLVRFPARTQPARCAGCALDRNRQDGGELGTRCGHSGLF